MKAISRLFWLPALCFSTGFTWSQVFPQQSGSGPIPATNILSSIPTSGILRIDYNFYVIPDTLDIYYDHANIFHSGPIQNFGEFNIRYGPGTSTELTIVLNQDGGDFNTNWEYIPSVVPAPPGLSIALGTNGVTVSWPAVGTYFVLEATSDLTAPAAWTVMTNEIHVSAATISVVIQPDLPKQFFRLRGP
jgi:hypothetical protein